ncbi:MAG: histidine kinase [Desulfuromonadales bacterium]|nr:histidine kinase [Desulfuromonadales bacterium]
MALPVPPIHFRASFRFKLFALFTLLTAIGTILCISLFIITEIRMQRRMVVDRVHLLATHLADSVRLPLYAENRDILKLLAEDSARNPEIHAVAITSQDGTILAELHKPDGPRHEDLISDTVEVRSNPLTTSPEEAITGDSIPQSGSLIGSVHLEHDTIKLARWIRQMIWTSVLLALSFWLTVSLLSYLALRQVTSSFMTLMSGIQIVRKGDYSYRIAVKRDDEPGRAATAVNELAASLQERERENQRLQEELVNTMRLEVQEEKRQIMAKLIQTNRMTSLGLLISSIAHNINTPNGAIKLAAQHLAGSWRDALPILEHVTKEEGDFTLGGLPFGVAQGEIRGASQSILNNAERVERVIQDLRAYNLGERNELSPGVSVNRVVREALTIIRAHGRQGEITIAPALASDLPDITGNQYQLEQVVVNLLLNAIQAMPNNQGSISVRTEFAAETAEVWIIVTDHGEGIPPEIRKHLFEAFFSTRIDKGGSGLGLYISNFIVSEHKGRLTIDSEPGSGTVVAVHLPVAVTGSAT